MAVSIRCPNTNCGKTGNIPEGQVGKPVRCPHCRTTFTATPISERILSSVESPPMMAPTHAVPSKDATSSRAEASQRSTESRRDVPRQIGRFQIRARLGAGADMTVKLWEAQNGN